MTSRSRPLPALPHLRSGEDITAHLARTADANYLTLRELTGLPPRSRVWEHPPGDLLERLSVLTGTSVEELNRATLRGAFPGMQPERARTGRRYVGQPATCPQCGVVTVAARLNIVVLCPECECLLRDPCFERPSSPAPALVEIHREVLTTLALAHHCAAAQGRLRRVEALMAAAEHALWEHWPPHLAGESPEWRQTVADFLRWATQPGNIVARPPFVTATTLALTWPASATAAATSDLAEHFAIMSDPWMPSADVVPRWKDADTGYEAVMDLIRRRGVQVGHVPTIIRRRGEPVVLPEAIRTIRTAEAVILTDMVAKSRQHTLTWPRDIAALHGATINDRVARLAQRLSKDVDTHRRLTTYLTDLDSDGLAPLRDRRAALRQLQLVPQRVIESLPQAAATTRQAGKIAAAWVWLDATLGRPAGGPHPHLAPHAVLAFDEDLNPEGRLALRDWWQNYLQDGEMAPLGTVAQETLPAGEQHVS